MAQRSVRDVLWPQPRSALLALRSPHPTAIFNGLLVGAPHCFQRLASGTASLVLLLPILAMAVAGANGTFAFLLAELFPPRH